MPTFFFLAALCLAQAQTQTSERESRMPDEVARIVLALRERDLLIRAIEIDYREEIQLSDLAIAQRAKITHQSEEVVRNRNNFTTVGEIREIRDGRFALQTTRNSPDATVYISRLFHDGSRAFRYVGPKPENAFPAYSAMSRDEVRDTYEIYMGVRRLLGSSILPDSPKTYVQCMPLYAQFARAERCERLADEQVDGSTCIPIRWRIQSDGTTRRETVWLDPSHGHAIRKHREELPSDDDREWFVASERVAKGVRSCGFRRSDGSTVKYWYPSEAVWTSRNKQGNVLHEKTFRITNVRINREIPSVAFRPPSKPEGPTVAAKPEPAARGENVPAAEKPVPQDQRKIASVNPAADSVPAWTPGRQWSDTLYGSFLVLGVAGLCTACWLWRRG
jgi:hypothetical protein